MDKTSTHNLLEDWAQLDAACDFCLQHRFFADADRNDTAEEIYVYNSALASNGDPDILMVKEQLSKMACILNPSQEKYWYAWAKQLSHYDADKRRDLVDELDTMTSIIPAARKKTEFKHKFYTEFVGKGDVMTLTQDLAKPNLGNNRKARREIFRVNKEVVLGQGADLFERTAFLVEQAPEQDKRITTAQGIRLLQELKTNTPDGEPVAIANLYLSSAYLAPDHAPCFTAAKTYIDTSIKTGDEIEYVMETLGGLIHVSEEGNGFVDRADRLLNTMAKKFVNKTAVGKASHNAVFDY